MSEQKYSERELEVAQYVWGVRNEIDELRDMLEVFSEEPEELRLFDVKQQLNYLIGRMEEIPEIFGKMSRYYQEVRGGLILELNQFLRGHLEGKIFQSNSVGLGPREILGENEIPREKKKKLDDDLPF
ncbi:MAG: hypothetical protein BV456_11090 [Thermoplasmata archaeon M8B2D]|nr:MAG: hypothetical protein BV456_11090 [Thermoplasmata archaeon M8B2D]